MSQTITTIAQAKTRARTLKSEASDKGMPMTHSQALERVAIELGFRDWNTASSRLSNRPAIPCHVGDRVSGLYLKKPFAGHVHAIRELAGGAWFEVSLHFDKPVDVVEFESFSALRQRVTATISAEGVSWARTSDGYPHLEIREAI